MSLRSTAPVVLLALIGAGGATVFYAARPAPRVPAVNAETEARIVTTPLGGTVVKVMVSAGDEVRKGQTLLRLHAGELEDRASRAINAFEKTPLETLDHGAALIDRVPAQTWLHVISTDPERLAVEQEYVSAREAHEQAPNDVNRQRLDRASQKRAEAATRVVHPGLFDDLARRHHERAADVAWLRQQLENGEVKSPVDGKVAIFGLKPGDLVLPNGRLMLIEVSR